VATDGDIWTSMSWPEGWAVRHVAETGSTNEDLVAVVGGGAAGDRTVLVADHQTAGRGRLDRRWDAPPGANLLASIVISPFPEVAAEATHRIGLAAVGACRRFVRPAVVGEVGLKWPNDLLIGGRKLAGILAQRVPGRDAVVVGIGLNVRWAPDGATSLADHAGGPVSPPGVLAALLDELDALPADVASVYRDALVTIGQRVRVEMPGGIPALHGRAVDVDDTGRLVVVDDTGGRHVLDVGDVVHVRSGGAHRP
jgi:BirA family biotin operon repressor/biotin-[acetyl-CoA-carboxylase] ligase